MAYIRKRGSSWQVQVRREGCPPLSKSFKTKADASTWARDIERSIDRAEEPISAQRLRGVTVGDLLRRYSETITSAKRGAGPEQYRIKTLLAHSLAQVALNKLSPATIAQYRDHRLKLVKSGTVRRELAIVQHCFEVAKKEWGLPIHTNPVQQITMPEAQKSRERRLDDDEGKRLAAAATTSPWLSPPLDRSRHRNRDAPG